MLLPGLSFINLNMFNCAWVVFIMGGYNVWNINYILYARINRFIQYCFYFINRMDDDLKKGLLNRKTGNFDRLYEQCVVRIQRIKQKNDFMQKQNGTDVEESMRSEVHKQKQFIEKEIKQIKDYMVEMESKFKDPQSKNRLKQLKIQAQKQIQRNKIILKDLITKSFLKKSLTNHLDDEPNLQIQGGNSNYVHLNGHNPDKNDNDTHKQSLLTDQEIQIDYDLQRKMMMEKSKMINQVEQSTQRINLIMNDMGYMVCEQGENLEVISEELIKTNTNMKGTNQNLEDASVLQKKSKKKYIIFVIILLVFILIGGGIIFFVAT